MIRGEEQEWEWKRLEGGKWGESRKRQADHKLSTKS